MDMLSRGGRIFDPKMIRVFVLDEADEMIAQQGLGDQTSRFKRFVLEFFLPKNATYAANCLNQVCLTLKREKRS